MANNFCSKCGEKIKNEAEFCTNCGTKVASKSIETINKEENSASGNIMGIVSLILFLGSTYGFFTFSAIFRDFTPKFFGILDIVSFVSSVVLVIIGNIKYPKNSMLKVTMWIVIVHLAFVFMFFALFFYLVISGNLVE